MTGDRLTWDEALDALVRGVLLPDALPERVAARVAIEVLAPGSDAGRQMREWGPTPAGGRRAREVAALGTAVAAGRRVSEAAAGVLDRYGPAGVMAALGIAALARMEVPAPPPPDSVSLPLPPRPPGAREVFSMVRRSFGEVPEVWGLLAWDPGALRRWWYLHEAAMLPSRLTGQEKWLAVVGVSRAAGVARLGAPYRRLLIGGGWEEAEIEDALRGESRKLRRGLAGGLAGASGLASGELDPARAWLAAADLSPEEARELLHLVRMVRGLSAYLSVRAEAGIVPRRPFS